MNKVSRRSLACYGTDQLLAGTSASVVARYLAAALIDSQRHKEVDLLLADINYELQSRGRLAAATVTTARQLSTSLRNEVAGLVKKSSKVQQVILSELVDKNIIGGVRIETTERTWDKTVTSQLNKLREIT